jgi:ABC-type branched-subunit amino acid transport system substrate-binding protein
MTLRDLKIFKPFPIPSLSLRFRVPYALVESQAVLLIAALCVTLLVSGLARAETGVTAKTILIGQSVSLTGPLASIGTDFSEGFKTYIDEVNRGGGVFGRQLKVVLMDDGYASQRSLSNTEKMIAEDGVFALAGNLGTGNVMAVLPLLADKRVPLFAAFTGADSLRSTPNRYLFTVMASYSNEIEKMVQHLTTIGITSIAVAYQNNPFGKEGLSGVQAAMKGRQLVPVAIAPIETDARGAASAAQVIARVRPQAVIVATAGKATIEFVREFKKTGVSAQLLTWSVADINLLVKQLGKEVDGMIVTQTMPSPFSVKLAVSREYRQLMKSAGKDKHVGYASMTGFVSAKALVQALRLAGPDLNREKFISSVESAKAIDLGGFILRFAPEQHHGSSYVESTMIRSGGSQYVY